MELRRYQREAFETTIEALEKKSNALIVIPTGGGKTAIMSFLCQYIVGFGGRVIVLSHVKELLEQTYNTIKSFDENLDVGIYSAGLKKRESKNQIICGQIQTVYRHAYEIGKETILIIDEAHLIPKKQKSRYQTFLRDMFKINPNVKLVGLTATPYRMDDGLIYGKNELFSEIVYEASIVHLIENGYLSPLRSKNGSVSIDTEKLKIKGKDFDINVQADLFGETEILTAAINDIQTRAFDRKKILVFCPNIDICYKFSELYHKITNDNAEVIIGETKGEERKRLIENFKNGSIKTLVNCQVLTTGFDAPNIDCVILLRATRSAGLYYQMVGRGLRTADGKKDCLILDYGKNIERHGAINDLREMQKTKKGRGGGQGVAPTKVCPQCQEVMHSSKSVCPHCEYRFPPPETKIETEASEKPIIENFYVREFDVVGAEYSQPFNGKEPGTRYIYIYYTVIGYSQKIKKFLGVEYREWWQRNEYQNWFKEHVDKSILNEFRGLIPESCASLDLFIRNGAIAIPQKIKVKFKEGKYPKIIEETIEHKPTLAEVNAKINARKQEQNNPNSYYYTGK